MSLDPAKVTAATEWRRKCEETLEAKRVLRTEAQKQLEAAHRLEHEAQAAFEHASLVERKALDGIEVPDVNAEKARALLDSMTPEERAALKSSLG